MSRYLRTATLEQLDDLFQFRSMVRSAEHPVENVIGELQARALVDHAAFEKAAAMNTTDIEPRDTADHAVSVLREAQRKAYADLADHFVDHGDKATIAAAITTNDFFLLGATPEVVYDAQAAWLGERFTPVFV